MNSSLESLIREWIHLAVVCAVVGILAYVLGWSVTTVAAWMALVLASVAVEKRAEFNEMDYPARISELERELAELRRSVDVGGQMRPTVVTFPLESITRANSGGERGIH